MQRITLADIEYGVGRTVIYLIILIVFATYKLFEEISLDHVYILISSILGILISYHVGNILRTALSKKGSYQLKFVEKEIAGIGLMIILGGLALYILLYKGFYGLYLLTEEFTWTSLVIRILVTFLGIKLLQSINKLQTGFNIIKRSHKVE